MPSRAVVVALMTAAFLLHGVPAWAVATVMAPSAPGRDHMPVIEPERTGEPASREDLKRLHRELEQIRTEVRDLIGGMNALSREWSRRLQDVSTLIQVLVGSLILVFGIVAAVVTALWQRVVDLEKVLEATPGRVAVQRKSAPPPGRIRSA